MFLIAPSTRSPHFSFSMIPVPASGVAIVDLASLHGLQLAVQLQAFVEANAPLRAGWIPWLQQDTEAWSSSVDLSGDSDRLVAQVNRGTQEDAQLVGL